MDESNNFPCMVCGHYDKAHYIHTESNGAWVYLDDVGHEVWQEEQYPRPVCDFCQDDCIFEQMTNLEYLEWKHDIRNIKE